MLNLPLHGPTCPTLAASPCPRAVICGTGWSGSQLGASQGNAGGCHPKLQHSSVHGSLPHWGLAAHPTAGWPQLCAAAGAALMFQLEENSHL